MTTEIRAPSEDEREAVLDLTAVSMNLGRSWIEHRGPTVPIDLMRGVFDDGRLIATAGGLPLNQWFGGRELDMCGVWGVATAPERRRSGLASAAVTRVLREARGAGEPISALFPATVRPYRRLGYELAGWHTVHEVSLDDLPPGGAGPYPVEEYEEQRDLEAVRACYRRSMSGHDGPVDSRDERWWPERVLGGTDPDLPVHAVVVRGPQGVEAYASFVRERAQGQLDVSFRLSCTHLVASSIEGYASLIEYFRGFRGLGQSLRFPGPPAEPLALLVEEQRVRPDWVFRWMLRLLDVPRALERRGYAATEGEAVVEVEDGLFPENRGPWLIRVAGGEASVEPVGSTGSRPIGIGTLSAMYSGALSPYDAVRLGLVQRDDPAVPALARLFSGSAPFMLDFF